MLAENAENQLDRAKKQHEYSGEHWKQKRASCFSEEAAGVIFRPCNEGRGAGEPSYDRKNSWKQKQRKAEKEVPGQNEGHSVENSYKIVLYIQTLYKASVAGEIVQRTI